MAWLHLVQLVMFPQVIFRNVHKLLADTASSEFLFCLDFWEDEGVFKDLFGPVVAVVEGDLSEQLQVRRVFYGLGKPIAVSQGRPISWHRTWLNGSVSMRI